MKETAPPAPWYKQFWPWFIISIPLVSIILSSNMLRLALDTEDSLVIDDYYKEGKAINLELSKIDAAKALNISTRLSVQGSSIAIEFITGRPTDGQAMSINFYHATLERQDFELLITQDANGVYRGQTEQPVTGKWNVTLTPLDNTWKIVKTVVLPQSAPILFTP